MNHVDTAFERLATAWTFQNAPAAAADRDRQAGTTSVAPGGVPSSVSRVSTRRVNAVTAPWVLVVRRELPVPAEFDCGLLPSDSPHHQAYRLTSICVVALDAVAQHSHVDAQTPRVLVLDIELLRLAGATAIAQLRRHLPATDILACWNAMPDAADVDVLGQVRGGVDWSSSSGELARALDAVVAGNLWFPRRVIEMLYVALIAGETKSPPQGAGLSATDTAPLTSREAEVFRLMRQGMTNKQIADRLDISVNTIKKHLAHVFAKRGLHGRRQERE